MDKEKFQLLLDYIETSLEEKDEKRRIVSLSSSVPGSMHLDHAKLSSEQLRQLADRLGAKDCNRYLTDISLTFNDINDEMAAYLVERIRYSSLLLLDLSNNPISPYAKQYIGSLLTENRRCNVGAYPSSMVKLYYWKKSNKSEQINDFSNARHTGHVALEIFTQSGKYIYLSYWPKSAATCCTMWKIKAKLMSKQHEIRKGPDYTEILLNDIELNLEKIVDKFFRNYDRWKTKEIWSIANNHCATRVIELLIEGGLLENFPAIDRFGSLRHLSLLCSSRIFIAITLLGGGLYPLLGEPYQQVARSESIAAIINLILLNGFIIFALEKRFEPSQLIESNNWDCVIGLTASFGFGFGAILHIIYITPLIHKSPSKMMQLLDLILIPATAIGMILFGKISSYLIDFFGGKGHTITPNNIADWMSYLKENKQIDNDTKKYIFYKNLSFAIIFYSAWIMSYTVRKLGFGRENSMFLGISGGAGIGYIIIKFLIHLPLEKKYFMKLGENDLDFIRLHHRNLEKHSILLVTTLIGIIIAVYFCNIEATRSNHLVVANPFLESTFSSLGGAIGFVTGHCIYRAGHCVSRFFSKKDRFNGLVQQSDEEKAINNTKSNNKHTASALQYHSLTSEKRRSSGKISSPIYINKRRPSLSCNLL